MNPIDHDTRLEDRDAEFEATRAWLEEHLLAEWDHLMFVPNGRVSREAAIVFGLLTQFSYLAITVDDIAATFRWDLSRVEQALGRLEQGLVEGHQRNPEHIARMMVVRDARRVVWIHWDPQPPPWLGRV